MKIHFKYCWKREDNQVKESKRNCRINNRQVKLLLIEKKKPVFLIICQCMIHIVVSRINAVPQDVERVCARKLIATRTMALVLSRRWWERKWEEKRKGVGESLLLFPAFFPSYLSITPAGYAYFAVGLTFFIIIFFFYFRRFDVEGDQLARPS